MSNHTSNRCNSSTYSHSKLNLKQKIAAEFAAFRSRNIIAKSPFYRALNDLPAGLFPHWQNISSTEFNGIPRDAVFFTLASEGLMRFFDCVKRSKNACALPSKAADSVWHAWISLNECDPHSSLIDQFCVKHFGRSIPHIEAAAMREDMGSSLAASLVHSRQQEGKDPCSSYLPNLFSLDRKLRMPRGYSYQTNGDIIGFQYMSVHGLGVGRMQYPTSFCHTQLLALGLISQNTLDTYRHKAATDASTDGGASCGSSCGSFGNSKSQIGGSNDGAGDGGSSCGSSCGGGCSS